jgi:hypothetical protein
MTTLTGNHHNSILTTITTTVTNIATDTIIKTKRIATEETNVTCATHTATAVMEVATIATTAIRRVTKGFTSTIIRA